MSNDNNLKFSGICRPIDNLGRVVIPKEICLSLGIDREARDMMDIYNKDEYVVVKPYKDNSNPIGLTRMIDQLGRVTIPIEIMRLLNLKHKDKMGIYIKGDELYFKKAVDSCVFCNSEEIAVKFKNKCICNSCFKSLKGAALYE